MHNIDLLIFDLDGTLIDSRRDIVNSVNVTLKKFGLQEKSISEISSYIGRGLEYLIKRSLGENCDALFEKSLTFYEEYFRKHATDNTVLYPNVKEILEHFKNKRKVIITNRKCQTAQLNLKALSIFNYFVDILGSDDLDCVKPSRCPLERAMRKFNVAKGKSMIVGDMDIDIMAGKEAGIITCAVTYGIGKKEEVIRAAPDYIIDDIIRLKDIIKL
jgi:phosphoglycolate phosphatase